MKILFTLLLSVCVVGLHAQKRYYDKIFDEINVVRDVEYGSNFVYNSLEGEFGLFEESQLLDIYLPPFSDTVSRRPIIIWAHGGSFLNGTKTDKDIVYFCNEFAKRGFVCVSINYRLGYELPIDSVNATRAVYRALQDGRAAVRYMRSVADSYKIDTSKVYFGGTSAGAFIALNIAYLNLEEEIPDYLNTSSRDSISLKRGIGLDGIEGKTNEISESSEIDGIINFCGATKVVSWLDDNYSKSIPVISMHGTEDGTVPYATRVINLNDLTPLPSEPKIPIIGVQGSYDIDRHADVQNYTSRFFTWYGADHVPYINYDSSDVARLYMDTLMSFTVKHVNEVFLGSDQVPGLDENAPPCDFNNGNALPCLVGLDEEVVGTMEIYPNPAVDHIQIKRSTSISIYNLLGKEIFKANASDGLYDISEIKAGTYLLKTSGMVRKLIKL